MALTLQRPAQRAADRSGAWIVVLPRCGEFTHDTAPGPGLATKPSLAPLRWALPRGPAVAERFPSCRPFPAPHRRNGTGHTSWGQIEHSPAPPRRMFRFGRRRFQGHTAPTVPLLQSPCAPVVVNPSPAMGRPFPAHGPVSPGHRNTATEGIGAARGGREGGGLLVGPGLVG